MTLTLHTGGGKRQEQTPGALLRAANDHVMQALHALTAAQEMCGKLSAPEEHEALKEALEALEMILGSLWLPHLYLCQVLDSFEQAEWPW